MWDFADRLPVPNHDSIVSLGEGMTPLVRSRFYNNRKIFWKNESINPTGSQKDRAISVAMSVARYHRETRVITASTGSVGLACAAYAARANLPCIVIVPDSTPVERLRPMLVFGAIVVSVRYTFEQIEEFLAILDRKIWYQASTIQRCNPYQSEGPKTIAFEIFIQSGGVPDWMVVPLGGGGTIFGIWKGFEEMRADGIVDKVPRLLGVQAREFNLLERLGVRPTIDLAKAAKILPDERNETISRNLKHGFPPDGQAAMQALYQSGGAILSVTDEDALKSQIMLARHEGIFCEPSSATVLAAVQMASERKLIQNSESVVCLITGSGLRETGVLRDLEPISLNSLDEEGLAKLILS